MSGMGGGSTTTHERPGALDFLNADVVSTLAPYLMENVVADLGGAMSADKSANINQAVGGALAGGAGPGTAQMFSGLNKAMGAGKGASGSTLQMAQMLYGKQPAAMGGGGSSSATPGLQDYTQSLGDVYSIYNNLMNRPATNPYTTTAADAASWW